jgi:signal transduction histidine kinase
MPPIRRHLRHIFFFISIMLTAMYPKALFSQSLAKNSFFRTEAEKAAVNSSNAVDYQQALAFFIRNDWDSTLIYTMRQLSNNPGITIADYCYYFRGVSFVQKKLFTQAKAAFRNISPHFRFYYAVTINLYETALAQENYAEADYYFKAVESLPDSNSHGFNKRAFYHNAGIWYLHRNTYDTAARYLFKSIAMQEAAKDTIGLVACCMDIGNLYYSQYKDALAIPWFMRAYRLSKKIQDPEIKSNAAQNMAVVEENRKQYVAALQYRKEYEAWNDSLNDQNKVWAMAEQEKQFALQQKQAEVNSLQTLNQLKTAERNNLIVVATFLAILLATGAFFYRQKIRQNKIIAAQKQQLTILNAEKNRLFTIVSHDLRSSVNALKKSHTKLTASATRNDTTQLLKLLNDNNAIANSTCHLLDNLLHWALLQTEQVYFQRELLSVYAIAEQTAVYYKPLMTEKNILFSNNTSKTSMVYADQESLKIILRNLLDNAIKFSRPEGSITISAAQTDHASCSIVIEDNGPGITEATIRQLQSDALLPQSARNGKQVGAGLGLQLCQALARKNDGKCIIQSTTTTGTRITITLPVNELHG